MNAGCRKRRVVQHIMEDESTGIVVASLPEAWVVRPYRPDYGLDLAVETFREIEGEPGSFETMGEHFFVQVKSVETAKVKQIEVQSRFNVAKHQIGDGGPVEAERLSLPVIPFRIDTSLLNTVEAMGSSVLVYLFSVALDERRTFFVCLNDYIDKIILPKMPSFSGQQSFVIHVPVTNEISRSERHNENLTLLRFFAKRAKFYSAFNVFAYQLNELHYCSDSETKREMAAHFLRILKRLDIWQDVQWPIVSHYRGWLEHLDKVLPSLPALEWFAGHPANSYNVELLNTDERREMVCEMDVQNFWNGLNALSHNYEEICREWFLPTFLAESLRGNRQAETTEPQVSAPPDPPSHSS